MTSPPSASPPVPAGAAVRPAAEDLGRAFKGCLGAVRRLRGRETRRSSDELSDAQYGLLVGVRDHDSLPTHELACLADLSPATATEMLDGLVTAGLVSRLRSDRDRRVVLISLTDRGRQLVAERHAQFAPRFEAALAEFSEAELRTASAVLIRLREMFDEIRPGAETADAPPPA